MSEANQIAAACAELIRRWHQQYGKRPERMNQRDFDHYRRRMDYFRDLDLSLRTAQEEIAREQQSGIFEWHYGAVVPRELWDKVAREHEILSAKPPGNLGEAARWILEHLRAQEGPDLPKTELRRTVSASSKVALLKTARDFYADVAAQQAQGLGGVDVLLSCSLERYPWSQEEGRHVTLLRPEALGITIVPVGGRADDLIDAIRAGKVVVEETIGGPTEALE